MILRSWADVRCRQGNGEAAARELAVACGRPLALQHGVKPTQLFSRNAEVDAVNSRVRACATRALQQTMVVCPFQMQVAPGRCQHADADAFRFP